MLRFNANLYRIAMQCSSKEDTRYYLQGVNVEPHAVKGVVMIATDGHRLICIHDESGAADESAIVRLNPEALKACKPGKGERRNIVIHSGSTNATICVTTEDADGTSNDSPRVTNVDCKVDGSFPDWRRVVPQSPMILQPDETFPHFTGALLADMCSIGAELEKHFDRYTRDLGKGPGMTQVLATEARSPALVLWNRVQEAFGVLMSCRALNEARNQVPAWLNAKADAPAPVLEAAE